MFEPISLVVGELTKMKFLRNLLRKKSSCFRILVARNQTNPHVARQNTSSNSVSCCARLLVFFGGMLRCFGLRPFFYWQSALWSAAG